MSPDSLKVMVVDVNSSMQVHEKDMNSTLQGQEIDEQKPADGKSGGRRGFKRLPRAMETSDKEHVALLSEGKKRSREEVDEMEIDGVRRGKVGKSGVEQSDVLKAGPVDRSCEEL